MRLSEFLRVQEEQILLAWDEFAATVAHGGKLLDHKALRDHAREILRAVAADMAKPESDAEQEAKSRGDGVRQGGQSAAETDADCRMADGFAIDAMITEYRALRASVLKIWTLAGRGDSHEDEMRDLMRFNEAIDQSIAEAVARYTQHTQRSTDLFIGTTECECGGTDHQQRGTDQRHHRTGGRLHARPDRWRDARPAGARQSGGPTVESGQGNPGSPPGSQLAARDFGEFRRQLG